MAIQVSSSVHAALSLFVTQKGEGPKEFFQSPNGCVVQRVQDGAMNGWLIMLDYALDVGSTGFSCIPFVADDPETVRDFAMVTPVLFHVDDRLKLVVLVGTDSDGGFKVKDLSFHASFLNFQANQQEFYPIELVKTPPILQPTAV
jgi:hypothetical protein